MALGIIHLSDIHLTNARPNPVLGRVRHIKAALQSAVHEVAELLLVVTGDVAFSGHPDEFTLAAGFIGDLEKGLSEFKGVKFLGTVVLPGNHDCDFRAEGDDRPVLINSLPGRIDDLNVGGDSVARVLEVQNGFFAFEELISGAKKEGAARLCWTREILFSRGLLLVRALNTAWLSRQKDVAGELCYPVQALETKAPSDAALVITLFHHPYGWLQPDNARSLCKAIETSSDVVLTGHEHDGDSYTKTSAAGSTNYVEGMALQAKGVPTGFNFLRIDLVAQTYQVQPFEWQDNMYAGGSTNAAMFTRNQRLLDHLFVPTPQFREELEDVGTPFTHPVKKQDLRLRDLYVYADLRVVTMTRGTKRFESTITSGEVLEYVTTNPLLSIAGVPTAGKTSLAKTLCLDLREQKRLVPILLKHDDFRGTSPSKVMRAIERAVERQYSGRLLERFKQLEPDAKVVLIDDWHRVNFNRRGKAQILCALRKACNRIVLFTDDASIFEQLAEAAEEEAFAGFVYCEIKQFGYRLRGALVTKWHTLGQESEVDEIELTHRIAASENLLDTLIGKGIVPSFPLFVFSVLQAHEGTAANNLAYGSFGHIYEALLTNRIARVSTKNLGLKYTYLSIIAYYLFKKQRESIAFAELTELHRQYETEYIIRVDGQQLLKELQGAQILSPTTDGLKFHYKAAYYFFVAKYFQEGIANVKGAEVLQAELRLMADMAHDEENAHIIIFYVYLTKDRPLIEHIVANAEKVFANYSPSDLNEDIAFVNKLLTRGPVVLAPAGAAVEDNRVEYRRRKDEAQESDADAPASIQKTSYSEDLADAVKIDFSFKHLQIMGQVLRNFPGDLRADLKVQLAQESYALALRTLRAFLRVIDANLEEVRDYMFRQLRAHQPFANRLDEELRQAANSAVIGLAETGIFGMIKKISSSVGLEDLKETYAAVRKNVQFSSSDVTVASVSPSDATGDPTTLTVSGNRPGHAVISAIDRVDGSTLSTMDVDVRARQARTVTLIPVTETTTSTSPAPLPPASTFQDTLNTIFNLQTNIYFTVNGPTSSNSSYDLDGDRALLVPKKNPAGGVPAQIDTQEWNQLIQDLQAQFGLPNTPYLHYVSFVRQFNPERTEGIAGTGDVYAAVKDFSVSGRDHTTAHEIGHNLGLGHLLGHTNEDKLMHDTDAGGSPCRITRKQWLIASPLP